MKKNINHLLLNSLLNTDYFFLKNNYFLKNFNLFNLLKLHKKSYLYLLNPLDIVTNLKQFLRLVQFFNKRKLVKLNFFVQEIHQENIIKSFIYINKIHINIKIFFKFLVLKKEKKSTQFLIFLKEYFYKQQRLSQDLLKKKIYLVQEINANTSLNNLGSYKMFNSILDYKKLILLLVFIKQVWKKTIAKKLKKKINFNILNKG